MTGYITHDGKRYLASSAAHLVRQLRRDSFVTDRDDAAFMTEYAARAKLQNRKADIPTDTVDNFVAGLILAKLLTKEEVARAHDDEQYD